MKFNRINLALKKFDWLLFITICLLMILGLVIIYSVAKGSGSEQSLLNFKKQIVFFILGLFLVFIIAIFFDYRILIKYNAILFGLAIVLLVAVLFFGKTIRGTTGWFKFGILAFQPVEFVKIFLVVYLSKFFSARAKYLSQFKYLVQSSLGVILIMILVILQPDFGTALIIFSLWLILILLTGLRKSHFVLLICLMLIFSSLLWFFILQDYQKERISVFLNPNLDPLGRGYNVSQAKIAIGSGQLFGKGLTFGSQSQLKFLPESQTDFIFAVLAEELGLAGIVLLLSLMAFLFFRLIKIAQNSRDNFALYLIVSTIALFSIQIVINIGGNLGLLPITGITLPFVSYGGSSLLANLLFIGLIESIVIRE